MAWRLSGRLDDSNWPGTGCHERRLSGHLAGLSAVGQPVRLPGCRWPTHRSRQRFSQRAAGLPWNLTFADAAEKVRNGDSGHSQVAITDLGMVPAERLHPTAAYSRGRPGPVSRSVSHANRRLQSCHSISLGPGPVFAAGRAVNEVTTTRRPTASTTGLARACGRRYRRSRPSAHVVGRLPR